MSSSCLNCGYAPGSGYIYSGEEDFFVSAKPFTLHNEPPMDSQLSQIRDSLGHAKTHLSRVDDQISRLNEALRQLNKEREMLQECVDEHNSALSPTRRLPTEILAEILLLSIQSGDYDTLDASEGPWVLAQVCKRWKTVMEYPKFWSSIIISVNNQCLYTHAIPILEEWLRRSADYPLSITFHYPDTSLDIGRSLLDTLLFHSRRWRTVNLSLTLEMFLCLMQVKGHLPMLEKLAMKRLDKGRMEIIHAFDGAPKLRDLRIFSMHNIPYNIKAPWAQLTRYEASEVAAEEHLAILNQTTCLTECDLYSEGNQYINPDNVYSLPHLKRMTFAGGSVPPLLIAPSLDDVYLKADRRAEDTIQKLTVIVNRSDCNIKHLRIDVFMHREHDLISLLRVCPDLTSLQIHFYDPSMCVNQIITALHTARILERTLVPCLTRLSITLSSHRNAAGARFDHIAFVEMVESRCRVTDGLPVSRLRFLGFDDKEFTTQPRALQGLAALKSQGLNVVIKPAILRDAVFLR
ncbi:hypothetical protein C8J56DRAFT_477067 [Mycena floridula]|nr:hypothetical protein C8J56DRAFT_477067 [Mycena floridula]